MEFDNKIPEWKNTGTEPNEELKENGFQAGYRPPAGLFNWFWSKVIACINELQSKFKGHADDKNNPHNVTVEQLNAAKADLTNIDNDVFKNKSESAGIAVDVYGKDETCTDETLNLFNCETPNSIFEQIGGHWWRRRTEEIGKNYEETTVNVGETNQTYSYYEKNTTFYYSDSYELKDGVYILVNPSSIQLSSTSEMSAVKAALKENYKYFMAGQNSGDVMFRGREQDWNSFNIVWSETYGKFKFSFFTVYKVTTTTYDIIGEYEYVHSTERNKYPDSGKDGIFSYSYLGTPFENAREAPKFAQLSYVGTGSYGSSNRCIVPCPFTPKLAVLVGRKGKISDSVPDYYDNLNQFMVCTELTSDFKKYRGFTSSGNSTENTFARLNGNSIEWYYTLNANDQCNTKDYTYYLFVWG